MNDEEDEEDEEEEADDGLFLTDLSFQLRSKLAKTMAKHELVFVCFTHFFVSVLLITTE